MQICDIGTNGGEYQYKIKVWEHSVWLLKIGWLLKKGDREHRFDCRSIGDNDNVVKHFIKLDSTVMFLSIVLTHNVYNSVLFFVATEI